MAPSPRRSCVSCRTVKSREELVRVYALPGGTMGVDLGGGVGRGAYVCPRRSCLAHAAAGDEFGRRLKVQLAPIQVETLEGLIRERVSRQVISLLGLARRARRVVSGSDAVRTAVKRHKARLILTAVDASASSVGKIRALAAAAGADCHQILTQEALGAALGGAPRSCVVVTDSQFARAVLSALERVPGETEPREHLEDGASGPTGRMGTGDVWR